MKKRELFWVLLILWAISLLLLVGLPLTGKYLYWNGICGGAALGFGISIFLVMAFGEMK